MTLRSGAALAAALVLSACGGTATVTQANLVAASASGPEGACQAAVRANSGGGSATVVSSQASGSGSVVTLRSANGQGWTCQTASSGVVTRLSIA